MKINLHRLFTFPQKTRRFQEKRIMKSLWKERLIQKQLQFYELCASEKLIKNVTTFVSSNNWCFSSRGMNVCSQGHSRNLVQFSTAHVCITETFS